MVTLASHKTFLDRCKESSAELALFFYSDEQERVLAQGAGCDVAEIKMHDVVPGHRNGRPLPETGAILIACELLAESQGKRIVIADPRGKGLATAFAIIARFIELGAMRKAMEEIYFAYPDKVANGFVLQIADAILGSPLFAGSTTYGGKARYLPFDIDNHRAKFAEHQEVLRLARVAVEEAMEQQKRKDVREARKAEREAKKLAKMDVPPTNEPESIDS